MVINADNSIGDTINVATVFSGIGAFEQAIRKIGVKSHIVFACDNGERALDEPFFTLQKRIKESGLKGDAAKEYIAQEYDNTGKPNLVKKSYFANYNISDAEWYEDIRFIDGRQYKNKVDLFVGGSPCQSFSIIGKKAGLDDVRGTLFYEYARLIKEIRPKAFIYENVPGMLIHDQGHTWKVIQEVFSSLKYDVHCSTLNSKDYGIPQDRRRLFVVGFRKKSSFSFPKTIPLDKTMFDFLEPSVPARFYLARKGFEFTTNPKYSNRARVNREIIQTEKANQQFNWNGDFLFEPIEKVAKRADILARAYVGNWNGQNGVIRQLTPRECHRLMGFPDTYNIVVPDHWAWRQAGNSIVVNVMEALVLEVLKAGI